MPSLGFPTRQRSATLRKFRAPENPTPRNCFHRGPQHREPLLLVHPTSRFALQPFCDQTRPVRQRMNQQSRRTLQTFQPLVQILPPPFIPPGNGVHQQHLWLAQPAQLQRLSEISRPTHKIESLVCLHYHCQQFTKTRIRITLHQANSTVALRGSHPVTNTWLPLLLSIFLTQPHGYLSRKPRCKTNDKPRPVSLTSSTIKGCSTQHLPSAVDPLFAKKLFSVIIRNPRPLFPRFSFHPFSVYLALTFGSPVFQNTHPTPAH